jgi:dTDP-glucose pyrophosphorylase
VFRQPNANDKKWSYARLGENGLVVEVQEKIPISDIATTGIYYWTKAGDFVKYAKQMIVANLRVNNEFYVCPVYNEAIQDGKRIKVSFCRKMWGLGIPSDLEHFVSNYRS